MNPPREQGVRTSASTCAAEDSSLIAASVQPSYLDNLLRGAVVRALDPVAHGTATEDHVSAVEHAGAAQRRLTTLGRIVTPCDR